MNKNIKQFAKSENCPIRSVLDRFGDKWSVLIILLLGSAGVLRFNEIQKLVGDISQKMLTVSLRHLEADGLVVRKLYPQVPPKVEYKLSELGHGLLPLINQLSSWASANFEEITESRKVYEEKNGK